MWRTAGIALRGVASRRRGPEGIRGGDLPSSIFARMRKCERTRGAMPAGLHRRSRQLQPHEASDDQALDFVGPLADLVDLLIAIHSRDRIFVHEAIAAVDLHGLVDHSARHFA